MNGILYMRAILASLLQVAGLSQRVDAVQLVEKYPALLIEDPSLVRAAPDETSLHSSVTDFQLAHPACNWNETN